ncbi:MAG: Panacea domain-containing protein [Patescibacteria group bacterium]
MSTPDYKKITQSLNYVARKEGGHINYMKALKLLYLADRLHLRKYGRLISDDTLVAMKNGTLGSQARDIVLKNDSLPHVVYEYAEGRLKRDLGKYSIGVKDKSTDSLSETDVECLDTVYGVLGDKGEFDLAKLTHELPEWKRFQYPIEKQEVQVAKLLISDLFETTENKELNKIYSQSKDEIELSRSIFKESVEQEKYLV